MEYRNKLQFNFNFKQLPSEHPFPNKVEAKKSTEIAG